MANDRCATCWLAKLRLSNDRQVYLQAAASFVGSASERSVGVNSILGILVASDDSSVFQEVQLLASLYFPNVQHERVVSMSFGTDVGSVYWSGDELATTTKTKVGHYALPEPTRYRTQPVLAHCSPPSPGCLVAPLFGSLHRYVAA